MQPSYIDIGANLTSQRFHKDRDQVIANAKNAGVIQQIVTGANLDSSQAAAELCKHESPYLTSTAGFHPHHVSENTATSWQAMTKLWTLPSTVAIGETGLDYFRNFSSPTAQKDSFEKHLQAACEIDLPLFLHERDAAEDFYELLSHYRSKLLGGVVLHCFTGAPAWLQKLMSLDIYFGVTGWVDDPIRGQALRESVPLIPSDRILIETDAPYLLPKNISKAECMSLIHTPKPKRNEPALLPYIAHTIAQLRDCSVATLSEQTLTNSRRLFRLS